MRIRKDGNVKMERLKAKLTIPAKTVDGKPIDFTVGTMTIAWNKQRSILLTLASAKDILVHAIKDLKENQGYKNHSDGKKDFIERGKVYTLAEFLNLPHKLYYENKEEINNG